MTSHNDHQREPIAVKQVGPVTPAQRSLAKDAAMDFCHHLESALHDLGHTVEAGLNAAADGFSPPPPSVKAPSPTAGRQPPRAALRSMYAEPGTRPPAPSATPPTPTAAPPAAQQSFAGRYAKLTGDQGRPSPMRMP